MDNTLLEINKHKFNIAEFSQKLIRTFDLNDEMFITNEIKKEIEFLFSLYNIKNNIIKNQMPNNNNMNNFFNPLLNPNFNYNQYQQILQQQMMQFQQAMQQQEMMMRQQMEDIQKEQNQNNEIDVFFHRLCRWMMLFEAQFNLCFFAHHALIPCGFKHKVYVGGFHAVHAFEFRAYILEDEVGRRA